MKNIYFVFFITIPVLFLSGCAEKTDQLRKFNDGQLVLWRSMASNESISTDDCSKVIESSEELLDILDVRDKNYNQMLFWGKKAQPNKIENYALAISPKNGDFTSFSIQDSQIVGGELVITAKRDDGVVNFIFKQIDENSIRQVKWSFKNPTPSQQAQYDKLEKDNFIKSVDYKICNASSYRSFIDNLKEKASNPANKIGSAIDYIKNKMWSDVRCHGSQSMYIIFTEMFGEVVFANDKTTLSNTNIENEFFNESPESFDFNTKYFASDISGPQPAINALVSGKVTLLSPEHIKVQKTISFPSSGANEKTETSTYLLCPG